MSILCLYKQRAICSNLLPLCYLALLSYTLIVLISCDDEAVRTYRGIVVDVKESEPFVLSSINLEGRDGEVKEFRIKREMDGFTPSHLREHMVLGAPVFVRYRDDGGILVIVSISD